MSENYWIKFWNESDIIHSKNPHNQVGRTINKAPIDEDVWQRTLKFIFNKMSISKQDVVLDFCAGNGLISIPLSRKAQKVIAVDISEKLITQLENKKINNIITIKKDIRTLDFKEKSFSKAMLYFAIQHFSEKEIISIFENAYKWLKPHGIFYVGDIPDIEKMFEFFNNKEREKIFFDSTKKGKPIIGTWFYKTFLIKLGEYAGFKKIEIIKQPVEFINSHYRFDIKLVK